MGRYEQALLRQRYEMDNDIGSRRVDIAVGTCVIASSSKGAERGWGKRDADTCSKEFERSQCSGAGHREDKFLDKDTGGCFQRTIWTQAHSRSRFESFLLIL
jgi:hypothetical protein